MDPKYNNKLFIGGKDVIAVSTDSVISKINSTRSLTDGTYGLGGNVSGRTFNIPRITITDGIISKIENSSETVPLNHCTYCSFCTYCGQNHCTKCPQYSQYTYDNSNTCFVKGDIKTIRGIVDVSELVVGDKIICDDAQSYEIVKIVNDTIGNRKAYVDGDYILTDDHIFFNNDEYFNMREDVGDYKLIVDGIVVGEYKVSGKIVPKKDQYLDMIREIPHTTKTYSPILKSKKPVFITLPSGIRALFPISE